MVQQVMLRTEIDAIQAQYTTYIQDRVNCQQLMNSPHSFAAVIFVNTHKILEERNEHSPGEVIQALKAGVYSDEHVFKICNDICNCNPDISLKIKKWYKLLQQTKSPSDPLYELISFLKVRAL